MLHTRIQSTGAHRFILLLTLLAAGFALLAGLGGMQTVQAQSSGVIYVDADATGADDGSSWGDAYTTVQDALNAVGSGNEIWVAAGIYYPDEGAGQTDDDQTTSFQLSSGVALYGGFTGAETARTHRDWQTNVTVLSGDIDHETNPDTTNSDGVVTDVADINGSNAYHVVTGSGTDATAVLDGFTITAGRANGSSSRGGGMYNNNGSPTVRHATFSGNWAGYGGGMFNDNNSSPTISHATFSGNWASYGGGMYNFEGSSPTISHATFSGNSAGSNGGGMYNNNGSPTVSHATFSDNSADFGGGIYNYNSSPTISHTTFSNNSAGDNGGGMLNLDSSLSLGYTIIANSTSGGDCVNSSSSVIDNGYNLVEDAGNACGLTDGTNNNIVGSDPDLGPLADNGGPTLTHKPNSGSPAIDAGGNCAATIDQRGAARDDGSCDIGAVEARETITRGTCGGSLSGSQTFPFSNGTVTIDVDSGDGIGCITVEEMGTDHLAATGSSGNSGIHTGNWWHITADVTSGFDVAITLPYASADADSRVCKWPGGLGGDGWDCGDGGNTTFGSGTVTRSGVTSFSDWAVGDNVGPTSVTLAGASAQAAGTPPATTSVALALLLGAASITVLAIRRRHTDNA